MTIPSYQTADHLLPIWEQDVRSGNPPLRFAVGEGELGHLMIGPGLVTLIGGAPGVGKTALVMQCVLDALRLNPELRAVICNVEMSPSVLLDRQLARLSGVDATTIRDRRLTPDLEDRIRQGIDTLAHVAERLCFVRPPFSLDNIASTADEVGAQLLLLDYIQRIPPPGSHGDRRGSIDATMQHLRQFAEEGYAVVVVAAVARQRDQRGRSSYDSDLLSLASFRESSELEFGADDAYILVPVTSAPNLVTLRHLKARHAEPRDLALRFERRYQHFTPATITPVELYATTL